MRHSRSRSLLVLAVTLALPLLAAALPAQGERPREGTRIVVIDGVRSDATRDVLEGLKRRLDQVGRKAELEVVAADGAEGRAARASADIVVALGSRALATATRDYKGAPIVASLLARESAIPEGTATAAVVLEFPLETEFAMLHRLLPNVRRVGVLYGAEENARVVARARDVAQSLGLQLVARRVATPAALPSALSELSASVDVLWGLADDVVLTAETAKAVLLYSMRSRVPFVGLSAQWVKAGALYALDRDYADLGAQTADVVARLLEGTPTKALPTVFPRKSVYVINAYSAEMMRVSFGADVLRGAREVIR